MFDDVKIENLTFFPFTLNAVESEIEFFENNE